MGRASLSAAKAELFAFLHVADTESTSVVDGVAAIYDHHPGRGEMKKPITVTVTPALVTPDDWVFAVRVFASIETDAGAVEETLEQVVTDIEALVSNRFGPSDWKIDPHPTLEETLLAEWLITCGREDEG